MYSADLSARDRTGPAIAVILVHIGLGAMLLGMSGQMPPTLVDTALKVIDLRQPPPPPPPPPPPVTPKPSVKAASAKPKAAALPAKKAVATPIVAPKPKIAIPTKPPVVAAPVPNQGTAPSQGAATAGAGTGAGGAGNGTGGGGNGSGGDGDDGSGTRPRSIYSRLDARGFPRALVEPLPHGAKVMIIFSVQLDGTISNCSVRQSSGTPALDAIVCQAALHRFRYEPARHGDGRPYVAKSAYLQVFF